MVLRVENCVSQVVVVIDYLVRSMRPGVNQGSGPGSELGAGLCVSSGAL